MTPCREWAGRLDRNGYGRLDREGRAWYVHRWVWSLVYGPIPDGLYLCHRCDTPACYRVDHLFLGTQRDNLADMTTKGRRRNGNEVKTQCPQGHPYDEDNTYINPRGHRDCRACRREAVRRCSQRRRA